MVELKYKKSRGGLVAENTTRKIWGGIIILILIAVAVVLVIYLQNRSTSNGLLGGDRDSHGCIGSAGYTWCQAKDKCLRTWEEPCQ